MTPKSKATKSFTLGHTNKGGDGVIDQVQIDHAMAGALRVFEGANGAFTESRSYLERRFETSPATVIAGAVAAGFIVGGGVFTPLTGRLFSWTIKIAALVALVSAVRASLDPDAA